MAHKEAYLTDDVGIGIGDLTHDRLKAIVLLDFMSVFRQYPNVDNFLGVVNKVLSAGLAVFSSKTMKCVVAISLHSRIVLNPLEILLCFPSN